MEKMTIQIDEDALEMLGKAALEKQIQAYVKKLLTKTAAQELLLDLDAFDLSNDPEWQRARELAWEEEKEEFEEYLALPTEAPAQFEESKDDVYGEESLGQKIESLLNKEGIYSMNQLMALPADELKAIFERPDARVRNYKTASKKVKKKSQSASLT